MIPKTNTLKILKYFKTCPQQLLSCLRNRTRNPHMYLLFWPVVDLKNMIKYEMIKFYLLKPVALS